MIITIDTTKEGPEEIRKAVRMLSALLGDAPAGQSQVVDDGAGPALASLFAESKQKSEGMSDSALGAQVQAVNGKSLSASRILEEAMAQDEEAGEEEQEKAPSDEAVRIIPY